MGHRLKPKPQKYIRPHINTQSPGGDQDPLENIRLLVDIRAQHNTRTNVNNRPKVAIRPQVDTGLKLYIRHHVPDKTPSHRGTETPDGHPVSKWKSGHW